MQKISPIWAHLASLGPVGPFGHVWPREAFFGPFWPRLTPFGPVWPCLAPFGPVLPRLAPLSPAWPLFNFHLKFMVTPPIPTPDDLYCFVWKTLQFLADWIQVLQQIYFLRSLNSLYLSCWQLRDYRRFSGKVYGLNNLYTKQSKWQEKEELKDISLGNKIKWIKYKLGLRKA